MTTTLKTMLMRLKLQRTAAAAAAVMARAPSPQANGRRMAKETQEKTATYREQGRGEIKTLAFFQVYSTASLHCRADLVL